MNKIKIFIKETVYFIIFLFRLMQNRVFRTEIKKDGKGTFFVLANGPSLLQDIPEIIQSASFNREACVVMNFFGLDNSFLEIKPKYYCLADPAFFKKRDNPANDLQRRVNDLYNILENKVDWPLYICLPNRFYKTFKTSIKLNNKFVSVIRINDLGYKGYGCLSNILYKSKIASPKFQTVANMAIYIGLMKNYPIIKLYGVDHTFFHDLSVNSKSQLCSLDKHFYDDKGNNIGMPMLKEDGTSVKISDYIEAVAYMFKSHDELADLAKYLNIKIINCTKVSLIDSYERM